MSTYNGIRSGNGIGRDLLSHWFIS